MKFGSLRAVGRDGQLREYPIDLPALSVGRADDNGIVLDDPSISARHARIVIESGHMLVEDLGSEWGTFLGGQRLAPRTRNLVEPGQDLRFGEVRVQYAEPGAPPSPAQGAPAGAALAGAAAIPPVVPGVLASRGAVPPPAPPPAQPAAAIRATLTVPPSPVAPGEAAFATVSVENRGRIVDQVRLAITGVPAEWVSVSVPSIALLPGAREDVGIRIQPPRSPDSMAGVYECAALVISEQQEQRASVAMRVQVTAIDAVSLSLHPVQGTGSFRLTGRNDGNTVAVLSLAGADDAAALQYAFATPTIEIPPGEERTVQVRVSSAERPFVGQPQVAPFKITGTPAGPVGSRKEVSGQLMVKPPLRSLKPLAVIGLVALGVGAALAFFLLRGGDDQPASPTPTATPQETPTPNASAIEAVFRCDDDPSGATPPSRPNVTLPPVAGQLFAQNDPAWGNEVYAKANDPRDVCGTTIAQCGCAMTSLTNVLALFGLLVLPDGQPANPKTVNDYFNQDARRLAGGWVSRGYSFNNVQWDAITTLSKQLAEAFPGTKRIAFVPSWGTGSEEEIRRELRGGRPVILELFIRSPGYTGPHFIIAYGLDGDTILVKDPSHPEQTTLAPYLGTIQNSRLFREVEPGEDLSAIVVTVPANLRVTITDSKGRVVGTLKGGTAEDSLKQARADIPGAMYTFQPAWRDPTCMEKAPKDGAGTIQIYLPRPPDGKYRINVQDPNGGPTSVGIRTYDPEGNSGVTATDNPGPTDLSIDVARPKTPTPPTATATKPGSTAAPPTATHTPPPPTVAPTPTDTPIPTPSPSPTATTGPRKPTVRIECSPATAHQTGSGWEVSGSCAGTVVGTWTYTNWYFNGDLAKDFSGGKELFYSYQFFTTTPLQYSITFEACNTVAACQQARSVPIDIN
ncbi:MAG: FHA domain-containing protein [Thermoflexaceae bacterium]|nr:FHA domain-containing protein [Thermoflexaceae bacterium]